MGYLAPNEAQILHSFSMLTVNADGHPLMNRFHAPGDEKGSLAIVPADRREEWLQTDNPRDFLLPPSEDEFAASSSPLPPRKPKVEPEPALFK